MNEVYRSSSEELSNNISQSRSRSHSRGSNQLRNRSKGSSGSAKNIVQVYSGPKKSDPNRYMKYLSLRKRKVVEPYHEQKGLDTGESSVGQLTSQEDRENTATTPDIGEKILVERGEEM